MTGDPGAAGMRWLWDQVAGSGDSGARHRAAIAINVTTISTYAHGCGNDHYPGHGAPGTRTE
jgi:hypothetical protein